MSFDNPTKLMRLCRMTMENKRLSIKIGNKHTEAFDVRKGYRQSDELSCVFLNIILAKIVGNSNVNTRGTIFWKSVQLRTLKSAPRSNEELLLPITAPFIWDKEAIK